MTLLKCYQDYLGRKCIEDIKKKKRNQAEELKTKPAVTASASCHDMLAVQVHVPVREL